MTCHQPRRGLLIFFTSFQGSGQIVVHSARRMKAFVFTLSPDGTGKPSFTVRIERPSSIYMILPDSFSFLLLEGHPCWSTCGRRTRPFSGRAFRKHRTNVGCPSISFYCGGSVSKKDIWPLHIYFHFTPRTLKTRAWLSPRTARVRLGPSEAVRYARRRGSARPSSHYLNFTIVTPSPPSARSPTRNAST